MPYPLSYRRPAYVRSGSSLTADRPSTEATPREGSVRSGTSSIASGIPESLSFDRLISGKTFKPCTLRDFMNYLIYVEFAAENLQFYLWFTYYKQRFAALHDSERVLAQPWIPWKNGPQSPRQPPLVASPDMFKGTDFDKSTTIRVKEANPFDDGLSSPSLDDDASTARSSEHQDMSKTVAKAYEVADVSLQPFTIQPFREEITRVIATYIVDDAPRQLNLSSRERTELLQALAQTTHPSAFQYVIRTVETTLRNQAHPNFIRWVICNCNKARIRFCGVLGATFLTGGLACLVLLTLSHAHRQWRVISLLPIMIGVAMLYMVGKGVCLVLHVLHHRHLRPWELFVDNSEAELNEKGRSMDSFGSSNSYEDEPWIVRYEKRFIVRKIFDREEWIQETSLRKIHDTIFIQALLCGLLVAAVTVGVFCAVPQMHMF